MQKQIQLALKAKLRQDKLTRLGLKVIWWWCFQVSEYQEVRSDLETEQRAYQIIAIIQMMCMIVWLSWVSASKPRACCCLYIIMHAIMQMKLVIPLGSPMEQELFERSIQA